MERTAEQRIQHYDNQYNLLESYFESVRTASELAELNAGLQAKYYYKHEFLYSKFIKSKIIKNLSREQRIIQIHKDIWKYLEATLQGLKIDTKYLYDIKFIRFNLRKVTFVRSDYPNDQIMKGQIVLLESVLKDFNLFFDFRDDFFEDINKSVLNAKGLIDSCSKVIDVWMQAYENQYDYDQAQRQRATMLLEKLIRAAKKE